MNNRLKIEITMEAIIELLKQRYPEDNRIQSLSEPLGATVDNERLYLSLVCTTSKEHCSRSELGIVMAAKSIITSEDIKK